MKLYIQLGLASSMIDDRDLATLQQLIAMITITCAPSD